MLTLRILSILGAWLGSIAAPRHWSEAEPVPAVESWSSEEVAAAPLLPSVGISPLKNHEGQLELEAAVLGRMLRCLWCDHYGVLVSGEHVEV